MMAKADCRYLAYEHPKAIPDGVSIATAVLPLDFEASGVRHDDFCTDARQRSLG